MIHDAPVTDEQAAPECENSMPEWWDPAMKPRLLKSGLLYRDKDARWRHSDGRIANRAERRKAGLK